VFGGLAFAIVGLLMLVALPLMPFLLVGALVWLIVRPSHHRPAYRLTA